MVLTDNSGLFWAVYFTQFTLYFTYVLSETFPSLCRHFYRLIVQARKFTTSNG